MSRNLQKFGYILHTHILRDSSIGTHFPLALTVHGDGDTEVDTLMISHGFRYSRVLGLHVLQESCVGLWLVPPSSLLAGTFGGL